MTVRIENLQRHTGSIENLSVTHFDLWGPLTSRNTLEEYQRLLERAVAIAPRSHPSGSSLARRDYDDQGRPI